MVSMPMALLAALGRCLAEIKVVVGVPTSLIIKKYVLPIFWVFRGLWVFGGFF